MRDYNLITVLPAGDLGRLEEVKTRLRETLTRNKVDIVKEDDMGIRRLPHLIGNTESGCFLKIKCKSKPDQIKNLAHELQIDEGIMRFMVKRTA